MRRPMAVGVDGSEASLRAVDWAADEAALRGVPLHVVHASLWERYEHAVFPTGREPPSEKLLTDVLAVAAAKRARARIPGLEVTTEVVPEGPVSVLRRAARKAAALVLGSRGRGSTAELLLGSVSLAVAGRADGPVIVVRGDHDDPSGSRMGGGPVVVGVPAGPADSQAVRFAFREAARRGVPVEAVRAWHRPAHETTDHPGVTGASSPVHRKRAVEALETGLGAPAEQHPDVEVRRRIVEGRARTVLPDTSAGAALLVVGARHPHGRFGLHIGRVTHAVLHHAPCPVAVVPEEEAP
ncbi:universal stress protein [Streptomyces sp. WAC04114]|uniref:universal stress protein n=1 Tax=Streptomyces sp. WAC04114 TaxID=2867961 RepID=UPI001C8BA9EE|nr:universal stress protein [Streptomyces sp. WAC04114]MBX9360605.1 universal stress protein [Streptomyces sp. WAC04114]